MMSGCHSCIFNSEKLSDWYGCIWGDGLLQDCCQAWIPNSAAMAQMKRDRKNWRKIYAKRQKYNASVPEERRVRIDKKGEVVRIAPMHGRRCRELGN